MNLAKEILELCDTRWEVIKSTKGEYNNETLTKTNDPKEVRKISELYFKDINKKYEEILIVDKYLNKEIIYSGNFNFSTL